MPTKTEIPTCTCGRETEWEEQLQLEDCPICGEKCCSDCRHVCPYCDTAGCEACMIKCDVDSLAPVWYCNDECHAEHVDPFGLARGANEDKRNMEAALRQFLPLLEDMTTFDLGEERLRDEAVAGIRNSAKLYLTTKGGL